MPVTHRPQKPVIPPLAEFCSTAAGRSNHKGYLVSSFASGLRARTASDSGPAMASRALHESDAGPEFGLRHLSFDFTFWRQPVTQPSS